jgi:two-component system, OmpR family, sensor histidine kinase KdpD
MACVEIAVWVGAATGGVAALQSSAPAAGLGILYLLAVLAVAIRRGQVAALATAVVSVLVLNYLFITPRHRLSIAHSQDVVELTVLLIAAVVVGRLAATGREKASEAESRAVLAAARERESTLIAQAASAVLAGENVQAQLENIGKQIAAATGASRARVALEPVPSPLDGEVAVRLPASARRAWLYVGDDAAWPRADLERIAEPLARLVDVAVERELVAERSAEAEAARRTDVARTALLHAISHDLRSPLTAITTAAAGLRAGAAITDVERTELIDVIDVESTRLARLVGDLLDLSKIEAGAVAPQADWCDLHDVVTSAAAGAEADHPVEFSLPPDLPLIRADAAQLERVFANLIDNAAKFSPPGSPIEIAAVATGGRITVRVTDRGHGIPKRYRSRIFEPFFRGGDRRDGDGAGAPGGAGSGLGLAICRGFVEANGGRIALQSGGRSSGTSFLVSFPLTQQPVAIQ